MSSGSDGEVYLAADNEPLTKSEILNAVSPDTQICETKDQIKQGKVCDSSWTRRRIGWIPRYINFREYVKQKQLTQEIN